MNPSIRGMCNNGAARASCWCELLVNGRGVRIRTLQRSQPRADKTGMVWLFERDDKSCRLETRYDNIAAQYVLTIVRSGSTERTERFTDAALFRARLVALEHDLQGWTSHEPLFLKDGWRLP